MTEVRVKSAEIRDSKELDRKLRGAASALARVVRGASVGPGLRAVAALRGTTIADVVMEALTEKAAEGTSHMATLAGTVLLDFLVSMDAVLDYQATSGLSVSERQESYLEWLMATNELSMAAEGAGISVSLPYAWARTDPNFKARWNEARKYAGIKEV